MKIVSIIQKKGGVGKTTIAVHVAYTLKSLFPHLRVSLADADPQASALNWINRGKKRGFSSLDCYAVATDGSGKMLKQEINSISSDIIIIDLPPAIETVSLRASLYSHLMLVPVGSSPLDIEAARDAVSVCKEAIGLNSEKEFLLVPSRIRKSTSAGKELREVLANWGPVSNANIGLRVALADSATLGVGIDTFSPNSAAHQEITCLAKQVAKLLGLKRGRNHGKKNIAC